MLKLDLHRKSFAGHTVLEDIHLDLRHGDRIAVFGPSGVGKTTLLRIIAGLDKRFVGTREAPDEIALMFQNPTLLDWRTAHENLRIFHPMPKVAPSKRRWPKSVCMTRRITFRASCQSGNSDDWRWRVVF